MGLLTFSINLTLDGCIDHREGIADDETHAFFTKLMDQYGAMLWGRTTYEMMESYWPAVARGEVEAAPATHEWAVKLESKPKYVVSSTRTAYAWTNSHHIAGDLRTGIQTTQGGDAGRRAARQRQARARTGAARSDRRLPVSVHPRIAGHGPTLFDGGLPTTRRLELLSSTALRNGALAVYYRRAR